MGFLSDLLGSVEDAFKGTHSELDDLLHNASAGLDDLVRGDFSGLDDRTRAAGRDIDDSVNANPGGWQTLGDIALAWAGAPIWLRSLYGAGASAYQADQHGQDPWRAAAAGAAGSAVGSSNVAGAAGVTNPIAQGAINSAAASGTSAAVRGDSVKDAAVTGAITGGASAGMNEGFKGMQNQNYPYGGYSADPNQQQSPFRSAIGETTQYSQPASYQYTPATSGGWYGGDMQQPQSYEPSGGFQMPQSYDLPTPQSGGLGSGSWFDTDNGRKFRELLYGAREFMGNNAKPITQGLMALYGYNRANKAYKEQMSSLSSMFGQNSAYAQQMRQGLERRDAAAGRRSQYGPREVELQAALARNAAGLQPAMMQMQMGRNQNRDRLLNTAFQLGKPGLQWIFQQTRQPQQQFNPAGDGFQTDPYAGY